MMNLLQILQPTHCCRVVTHRIVLPLTDSAWVACDWTHWPARSRALSRCQRRQTSTSDARRYTHPGCDSSSNRFSWCQDLQKTKTPLCSKYRLDSFAARHHWQFLGKAATDIHTLCGLASRDSTRRPRAQRTGP